MTNAAISNGPFVRAAFFCETVLEEANRMQSFIRVLDQINVTVGGASTAQLPESLPQIPWRGNLVISLVGGRATGRSSLNVKVETPDGLIKEMTAIDVRFTTPNTPQNVVFQLELTLTHEGLHWFRVAVEDRELTRIPLEVTYSRRPNRPVS